MITQADVPNTHQAEQSAVTDPVIIANHHGFNAQMASLVANASSKFASHIQVFLLDRRGQPMFAAQADSVRRLLSLQWISGDRLVVAAYGHDARVAAETISALFKTCLGGEPGTPSQELSLG